MRQFLLFALVVNCLPLTNPSKFSHIYLLRRENSKVLLRCQLDGEILTRLYYTYLTIVLYTLAVTALRPPPPHHTEKGGLEIHPSQPTGRIFQLICNKNKEVPKFEPRGTSKEHSKSTRARFFPFPRKEHNASPFLYALPKQIQKITREP